MQHNSMGPSKFTRHWTEFSHSNIQCLCTETWLPRCELFNSIFSASHLKGNLDVHLLQSMKKKQSSSSTQIVLEVCFTFGSERTCACGYLWFLIRVVTIPHCYMLSLYPTSTSNITCTTCYMLHATCSHYTLHQLVISDARHIKLPSHQMIMGPLC